MSYFALGSTSLYLCSHQFQDMLKVQCQMQVSLDIFAPRSLFVFFYYFVCIDPYIYIYFFHTHIHTYTCMLYLSYI